MSPMSSALLLSTFFFSIIPRPPISTLFPYTTLFRSATLQIIDNTSETATNPIDVSRTFAGQHYHDFLYRQRSEEHTSELQSPDHIVCRLLLEKKNTATPFTVVASPASQGLKAGSTAK